MTLYLGGMALKLDTSTADVKTQKATATRYYSYAGMAVAMRTKAAVTWLAGGQNGTSEDRLEVQSMVYEVALPALDVILAAYAENPPVWVESEFLNALHSIILGEPHESEAELGNHDLVDRCIERARDGIWVLYARLSKFNADFLIDILEELDTDKDRFRAYRSEFSQYL